MPASADGAPPVLRLLQTCHAQASGGYNACVIPGLVSGSLCPWATHRPSLPESPAVRPMLRDLGPHSSDQPSGHALPARHNRPHRHATTPCP
ncbi:hypothetical protein NDU88_006093 [Pleurodeles waltl]|uniref:Uncharacterized protein n=1 Tax=Pleurodeles waltl TaxID=8319 RepID=A0AAV7SNK1_PLEWA|nr:hypothetical protein NDU88_006093 [Pleurodeles waltl]